jgi:hypothetical protein
MRFQSSLSVVKNTVGGEKFYALRSKRRSCAQAFGREEVSFSFLFPALRFPDARQTRIRESSVTGLFSYVLPDWSTDYPNCLVNLKRIFPRFSALDLL